MRVTIPFAGEVGGTNPMEKAVALAGALRDFGVGSGPCVKENGRYYSQSAYRPKFTEENENEGTRTGYPPPQQDSAQTRPN